MNPDIVNAKGKWRDKRWMVFLLTLIIFLLIFLIKGIFSNQVEVSKLKTMAESQKIENEQEVAMFEDSLRHLEISLTQIIPADDQINSEEVIADQRGRLEEGMGEHVILLDSGFILSQPGSILKNRRYHTPYRANDDDAQENTRDQAMGYEEYLNSSLIHFSKAEYKECLLMLDSMSDDDPRDVNVLFYQALCYFNLGKFTRSAAYFAQVQLYEDDAEGAGENLFKEQAEFYRALAKKRGGATEEAQDLLRLIAIKNSLYAAQAKAEIRN